MPFFSDSGPGGFQPKRAFRFLVSFTELSNMTFMVKTCDKPSYTIKAGEHQILNHVFKFPGKVTWEDVSVEFVDAVDPNVGSKFYNALLNAGYIIAAVDDTRIVEEWTLKNAWLNNVAFGKLTYATEDLVSITAKITFDYATYSAVPGGMVYKG